jgi:hypothetical protein
VVEPPVPAVYAALPPLEPALLEPAVLEIADPPLPPIVGESVALPAVPALAALPALPATPGAIGVGAARIPAILPLPSGGTLAGEPARPPPG